MMENKVKKYHYQGKIYNSNEEIYKDILYTVDNEFILQANSTFKQGKQFIKETEELVAMFKQLLDFATSENITFNDFLVKYENGELSSKVYLCTQEYDCISTPYFQYLRECVARAKYQKAHDFTNKNTTLYTVTSIAKCFKLSAVKLNSILVKENILTEDKRPSASLDEKYYHEVYYTTEHYTRRQLKWTEAGVKYIANLLKTKGYEQVELLPFQPPLEVVK